MLKNLSSIAALCLMTAFFLSCGSEGGNGGGGVDKLASETDSVSYAIGQDIATNLQSQGIDINIEAIYQAMKDVGSGDALLTQEDARQVMMNFQMKMQAKAQADQAAKGQENLEKGQAFLEQNKSAEGVQVHPSGMQYIVMTPGTGASPTVDDEVTIHYKGTLIDGTEFDSSYSRGEPASFPLKNLVQGWQIALPMMKEGGKWKIFLPTDLGYGAQAPPNIGPNQALIFEIELIKVGA